MLTKLSKYFYKNASWRTISGSIVIVTLYTILVMKGQSECYSLSDGSSNSLGLTFGYNDQDALRFFSKRSMDQLLCYERMLLIWDMIFPIIYGVTYLLILSFVFRNQVSKLGKLNLIPIAQVLIDYCENLHEASMLTEYLSTGLVSSSDALIGSILSISKWSLNGIFVLILFYGVALLVRKRF